MNSHSNSRLPHCNALRLPAFRQVIFAVWLLGGWYFGGSPQVLAQDGGWSVPIDISEGEGVAAGGARMICDPYQNLQVFWQDDQNVIYYRTDMNGEWSSPADVLIAPEMISTFTLQAGVTAADSIVHLVWLSLYEGYIYYTQAPLSGAQDAREWSPPALLASAAESAGLHVEPEGQLRIAYGTSDPEGLQHSVFYIESNDSGATWTTAREVYTTRTASSLRISRTVLARDSAGRLHLGVTVYVSERNQSTRFGLDSRVVYLRSLDDGTTWRVVMEMTPNVEPGLFGLAVFPFDNDEIHLTWHDPRRMHLWSTDGGEEWLGPEEIVPLGAAFGGLNELALDSSGRLHAVVASGQGVRSAQWLKPGWGATQVIDDRAFDPHGQNLVHLGLVEPRVRLPGPCPGRST